MREPLGKSIGRLFKDFAQGLLIGRISRIRAKEVFVHERDLKRRALNRKLTRLLRRRCPAGSSGGAQAGTASLYKGTSHQNDRQVRFKRPSESSRHGSRLKRGSRVMRFLELAAPQMKRHGGEVMLFAGH